MLEDPKIEAQGSPGASTVEAGVARRRLIRAGLAAAPVMLGLKSQSALAGGTTNHVKPSVWCSLKATTNGCLSHGGGHAGGTCDSYKTWSAQTSYPNFCNDYRQTRFHWTTGKVYPPFSGYAFTGKNCKEVLSLSGATPAEKLARHCMAMFLNAKTSTANSPISTTTCKTIWQSCSGGGTWTPAFGGPAWTIHDCNDYFDYICGISNPKNPPLNPVCLPGA